jgi:hypothetical protein
MTNVFSSVFSCLVIELKGKWSTWQRQRFHSTPSVLSTLCRYSAQFSTLVQSSLIFICSPLGRKYIGLIFHSSIHFWRFMPKGKKVWAKAKGPHHHRILKMKFLKLISYCVQKGEKVVSSKLAKPSWTLRGEFYSGEVLFKLKEKHLKQGEKISNLENASFNLIHVPLTICKKLLKRILQRICKNKTSGASVVQNFKKTIHAYL